MQTAPGVLEPVTAEKLTHRSLQHRGRFAELSAMPSACPPHAPLVMPGTVAWGGNPVGFSGSLVN